MRCTCPWDGMLPRSRAPPAANRSTAKKQNSAHGSVHIPLSARRVQQLCDTTRNAPLVTTCQVPTDENVDTARWTVVGRRAHANVSSPPTAPVVNHVRIVTVWR